MNIPSHIEYVTLYVKIIKERLLFVLDVKYKTTFVLFTFLLVSLVNSSEASEDKSPKANWQLIFLSPYGGCTNYQYQMTNFYDEVTMKYFQLYQFPNVKYPPICMPAEKYSKYKFPEDVGLLILVYDYEIGRKDLNNNDLGGAYIHNGDDRTKNNVIIFCDCPNFKFSDPTWILSHELSHFILYYLNYDKSIVEDKIHAMDKKYDYCTEVIYDNNTCSSVTTHLKGDHYFSSATVMAPYIPAIGKSIDIQQYSKIQVSPHIIDIQKKVTSWWLDGKINDTEYAQVLAYSVNEQSGIIKLGNYSSNDKAIVFPDGPDGKEMNETYYDVRKEWGKDKVSVVFSKIPSKDYMLSDNSQIFPDWFKARAQWWIQGKIWNDSEFLSSAKYLLSGNSTVK